MEKFVMEMHQIEKQFSGVKALINIDFSLKPGEIHALLGGNGAGKSTLIKVLGGIYKPDAGQILINGKLVNIQSVQDAQKQGIGIIHQEIVLVPYLSVAENIFLGREPVTKLGIKDTKKIYREAQAMIDKLGIDINAKQLVEELSIAKQQIVEIVKAISFDVKILVMDEPTSSLEENEVVTLFSIMRNLKEQGVSIIYISHKMEEIFQIADEITVFRDGKSVITKDVKDWTMDQVVECMVGRKIENQYPKEDIPIGEEILKVESLTQPGIFNNINFNVHAGEIIGFAGLMGAGRTEIMRSVFGLDPYSSGTITIKGKEVVIKNVRQAIKNGLAMLTEDRRRTGIVPILSVKYNTTLASMNKIIYGGHLHSDVETKISSDACKSMNVKTPNLDTKIANLSGGNQQKVILAKWLLCDPDILITDEPTRGIDVGAKREIYELMNTFAAKGKGIIMISSELPELIGICDRIYVVSEGRIAGMLSRSEFSQESIMQLAVSNMEHTEEVTSK